MPSDPHSQSDSQHRDLRIPQLRQKLADGPICPPHATRLASRSRVMETRAYSPCTWLHHRPCPTTVSCFSAPRAHDSHGAGRANPLVFKTRPKAEPAFVSTHPCKKPFSASISDRREPHGQSHADGTELAILGLRLDQHDIGRKTEW